jgi:hypothetical protein
VEFIVFIYCEQSVKCVVASFSEKIVCKLVISLVLYKHLFSQIFLNLLSK